MEWISNMKGKKALCAVIMIVMMLITLAPLVAYAATNPLEFTVNQVSTASDTTYSYRLKALAQHNPLPVGSTSEGYTFTITGEASVVIEIAFDTQGVYRYELSQVVEAAKPNHTGDSQVYIIEVWVDEMLDVKYVVINGEGTKSDDVKFSNNNTAGPGPGEPVNMVDPPVVKTVFGNPSQNSTFTFRLVAKDLSNPMPQGSENGVKAITITGSGRGEFGVWGYEQPGTYYYTVYEVNTGIAGYTYDTAVYTITDMVTGEYGELVLDRVVTNSANKQVTSLMFNNTYSPGGNGGETDPPPTQPPWIPQEPSPPSPPGGAVEEDLGVNIGDGGTPGGNLDGDSSEGEGPRTGDDSNTPLYITLLTLSGIVAIAAIFYLTAGGKKERGI